MFYSSLLRQLCLHDFAFQSNSSKYMPKRGSSQISQWWEVKHLFSAISQAERQREQRLEKVGLENTVFWEEKYKQWLLSSRGDIHWSPAKKHFFISWP